MPSALILLTALLTLWLLAGLILAARMEWRISPDAPRGAVLFALIATAAVAPFWALYGEPITVVEVEGRGK